MAPVFSKGHYFQMNTKTTPRFFYLVALYNEAEGLPQLLDSIQSNLLPRFPESRVFLLENGSSDNTWELCEEAARQKPWVQALRSQVKGLGAAFRMGFFVLSELKLSESDIIVLTAADLPFGFSDLDSYLRIEHPTPVAIGSKHHPNSSGGSRSLLRKVMSLLFRLIRYIFLGMKTRDSQGTFFIKSQFLPRLLNIRSDDYFFTANIAYIAESEGQSITELPVISNSGGRPSKVRIFKDSLSMLKSIWNLYREKGRIKRKHKDTI